MKKLLALVLALVMTMSLVTISNADFKDADDIDYTEAVEVMNAVGVLVGSDGKFNPQGNLTRSQACKIIAYLDLGSKAADAIKGSGAVFSDVPATAWYAGYVEYCAGAGYVSGVGGGKFDPDANVTGVQFAKMLLCALGYKAEIEGYNGSDWSLAIARDANKIDLFDALSIVTSAALTREQAAQMALNALQATVVKYAGGTNVSTSDGTTVTVNATRSNETTDSAQYLVGGTDQVLQLAEKLYKNDLKLNEGALNNFKEPVNLWTYKGEEVGKYAAAADKELKGEVEASQLYTAIGSAAYDNMGTWKVYANGQDVSATYAYATYAVRDSETVLPVTGNGSLTKVYVDYNSANQKYDVRICVTNTFLGKVSTVTPAEGAADRFVNIDAKSVSHTLANSGKYETESFAKGDYVLYTAYHNGSDYTVASATAAPAAVSAKVSSVKGTSNFVAGGETYKYSAVKAGGTPSVGDEIDIYCDAEGYVLYFETTAASADLSKYLVVYDTTYADRFDTDVIAKAITLDGTLLSGITIGKINGNAVSNADAVAKFTIFSYTKDSNGKYNLKAVAAPFNAYNTQADVTFVKGATKIGPYSVNNDTKFIVYNEADKAVTIYTGISAMPGFGTSGSALALTGYTSNKNMVAALTDDGVATAVLVYTTTGNTVTKSNGKDLVYILGATPVETADGNDDPVYTYDAIINGVVGKVATQNEDVKTAIDAKGMYYVKQYDSEYMNLVYAAGDDTGVNVPNDYSVYVAQDDVNGIKVSLKGGVLTVGSGLAYSVADDVVAYSITNEGVATVTTVEALTADKSKNKFTVVLKETDDVWYVVGLYMQK